MNSAGKMFPGMHSHTVESLADELETHVHDGLIGDQALARLSHYGPNELKEKPHAGFLRLLLGQFNNFLIILLLVAAAISFALG